MVQSAESAWTVLKYKEIPELRLLEVLVEGDTSTHLEALIVEVD